MSVAIISSEIHNPPIENRRLIVAVQTSTREWADHRECHIGGDFLLIYQIDDNAINFVRSGTHSELFE